MKKTFRSKDEHQEGEGDFSLIDDQGQKLLCSFDPKRAQEYGIGTAASCGRLYALCPICATSWGKGWWKLLNNARKCCSNRDIEQEELEVDALNKERAVLLRASMLMKPYYGIISKSKSKAEAWMKFNEIDPKRCIFMDEMKDVVDMLSASDDKNALKAFTRNVGRLAQKARSVNITILFCTQSPNSEWLPQTLRAVIPSVFAFAVSSAAQSRVCIGENGCEKLLGKGDGYAKINGKTTRIHGANVTNQHIGRYLK
jgi:hypothetical protein